ncbi:hypothetical protein J6590_073788 [Homalodisca vitripennis]|nr:hypothetical protein J6590_073788 [Homalodisca vitripennis]
MLEGHLQQPCISVTFKTCICLSFTEGAIKFQPLQTLPPVLSLIELWTPQVCTRKLQSGCTTFFYRQLALDSVGVKFVRNPLLWLFKNPVDFIKRVSATATTGPGTVTITAALSEPARTRTAPGRPAPCHGQLTRQGYHEPPYRGLPLHCCGIDHAFLDR